MAPDYTFGCIHCGYTLYIGKFNEGGLSHLHQHNCIKCGAEGHMNWAITGEGDRNEQRETTSVSDEDFDCGSTGRCGQHEHSDEEGV